MATIISLPAQRQSRPARAETQEGATILFFTGVRYVRDEDEGQGAAEPATLIDGATASAAHTTIN